MKTQLTLLKYRLIIYLSVLLICSTVFIFLILQFNLITSLKSIEKEDHSRNVQRVLDALEEDHAQLETKQADVSAWDDTYKFILDTTDKEYISSNMEGAVFDGLGIDLIIFKDTANKTQYFHGIDPFTTKLFEKIPPALDTFLNQKNLFKWNKVEDSQVGFVSDGSKLIQMSARPITNSLMTKDSRGTLIYIRFFTEERIKRFEKITQYKIHINVLPSPHQTSSNQIQIKPVSDSEVVGVSNLKDILKKEVAEIEITAPRHIYMQGKKTFYLAFWVSFSLCIALALVVWLLMKFLILNRLTKVSQKILEAKDNPDPTIMQDLSKMGHDEIGTVAGKIDELYKEVRSLADIDDLTGINNVRFFKTTLAHHLKLFKRYTRPSCLVLFDVDHFKKINDTYGHQQGDLVLKSIGDQLKESIRSTDVVARYGGEEFAIILRETDIEGAKYVAEKLRKDIESLEIATLDSTKKPIKITISLGISNFSPDMQNPEEVIKRSDEALYSAKSQGRNRYVVFPSKTI